MSLCVYVLDEWFVYILLASTSIDAYLFRIFILFYSFINIILLIFFVYE